MARDVEAGKAFVRVSVKENMAGLKNISRTLKSWGATVGMVGGAMTAAGSAVLAPLMGMATAFADAGSAIADMSARTGVSAEQLSSLGYAAGMTGASIEDLEKGLLMMQKKGMSTDKLVAVANKIQGMSDPAKRTAYAMEVFGKSGAKLIPMLSGGAAGLAEFQAEAERLGLVMSGEDAAAADALGDAMDQVKSAVKAAGLQVGAALAPALTAVATQLSGVVARVIAFIKAHRPMIVTVAKIALAVMGVGTAIAALGGLMAGAGMAISGLVTVLGTIGSIIGVVLSPVGLLVAGVVAGTAAFLTFTETGQWLASTLMADFGTAFDTVKQTIGGVTDALKSGEFQLAGEIALTGLKLAFFQGTKSIRSMWIDFNKSLVDGLAGAAKTLVSVWRATSQKIASWLADLFYRFNLLVSGQKDYLSNEERIGARDSALNEYYDNIQGQLDAAIDGTADAIQDGLNASLEDGEARIAALRAELNRLTGTAAERAANLPQAAPPPKPHEAARAAALAGNTLAGVTGTFSAAAARIAFAGGSDDAAKETAANTREMKRELRLTRQQLAQLGGFA